MIAPLALGRRRTTCLGNWLLGLSVFYVSETSTGEGYVQLKADDVLDTKESCFR